MPDKKGYFNLSVSFFIPKSRGRDSCQHGPGGCRGGPNIPPHPVGIWLGRHFTEPEYSGQEVQGDRQLVKMMS